MSQPAADHAVSSAGLLSQLGIALAGVLLLILLLAWTVRKFGLLPGNRNSRMMKVVASCPLGQRERVMVVEVEGSWLVLGVTAQQVTLLQTLPAQPQETPSAPPSDFSQIIAKVLTRSEKS